jgi:cellulose synthase (UDP-forming)
MFNEMLAPNLLVLGAMLAIATLANTRSTMARVAFMSIAIIATLRYLWWRWTDTLLDEWWTGPGLYTLGCFVFELLVSAELILGMVVLSRTTDRRAEADDGEAWARAQPAEALPAIDVLVPTFNEDRDVLERTIVGATSLDYPNFTVWVLDDGRRPWVAELAKSKGARYLTRANNTHAKAGNINAALRRTTGELILVLDADFVPRTHMLWRTVGFFRDPRVACLQTPQYFFNKDPTQTNLGLADRWADDQRLFFDVILPSRDAWGAAFCCGTGFLMRRSAVEAIGGGIPTGSICEDMLTSIEWKRRDLETIYLQEELCIGLAPESVKAFFIQRQRWARGQIQILMLKDGLFGPGLPLLYRLLLLPGYWVLQLPARIAYVLIPIIYLLFGLAPLYVGDLRVLIGHLGPMQLASVGLLWWLARQCYFPVLTDASALFQALRVGPAALMSFIKPFGKPFAVTPKGASARGLRVDRFIFYLCAGLVVATIVGLAINGSDDWRVVQDRATLSFAAFWAMVNCVILGLTALIAREGPRHRTHERFVLSVPARCVVGGEPTPCSIANLSIGGAFVNFGNQPVPEPGSTVLLSIPEVGQITGITLRAERTGAGIRFLDIPSEAQAAIRKLGETDAATEGERARRAALRIKLDARARLLSANGWSACTIGDASLSGARLIFPEAAPAAAGDPVVVDVPDVGIISARVVRASANSLGLVFEDVSEESKDDLIRFLYTMPRQITVSEPPKATALFPLIAKRLLGPDLVSNQPHR